MFDPPPGFEPTIDQFQKRFSPLGPSNKWEVRKWTPLQKGGSVGARNFGPMDPGTFCNRHSPPQSFPDAQFEFEPIPICDLPDETKLALRFGKSFLQTPLHAHLSWSLIVLSEWKRPAWR